MRLRTLALWLAAPTLLSVVLTTWLVGRAVESERTQAERLGQTALSATAANEAYAWINSEVTNLLALDAFAGSHPGLATFTPAAEAVRATDRDIMLNGLLVSDREGAVSLDQLRRAMPLPKPVEHVLRPLSSETLAAIEDGKTGFVDPQPYVDASRWVQEEYATVNERTASAARQLASFTERPSPWQNSTLVALVISITLLGAVGTVVVLWRVSTASRALTSRLAATEAEAAAFQDRSTRYRKLIELGRRMSGEADVHSLSHTLVEETRRLLGGDVVSLVRREGATVRPAVVAGELPVAAVANGHGVVGRTVDAGAATSTVVSSDPFVPGVAGPLALLTAPLVADGQVIGALVVGSRAASMFDDNDELALELLAFLAAGAVAAAQRYDSTVALTLRDPLTGLANRRKLDLDLAKSAVTENRVGFLMVDIDHFKAYNDRHGHQRGDALLRAVANAISSAVRQDDIVYRYGGEEFSVLLPGADATTSGMVGDRVRTAVRAATADLDARAVTVSVGVAAQASPISDSALLAQADAALYAAKGTGRDRVVMHGEAFR